MIVGDAQAAPEKKGKQRMEKGKTLPSIDSQMNGETPNRVIPLTGYRNRFFGCGSENVQVSHRILCVECLFRWINQMGAIAIPLGVTFIRRLLAWDYFQAAR